MNQGVVVALEELGLKGHDALHEQAKFEVLHPRAGYHFRDARASANEHAKEHGLPDYVVPIVEQLKQNTTACVLICKTGTRHRTPQSSTHWVVLL